MTREIPGRDEPEANGQPDGELQLLVASAAFAEFNAWIDGELEKLVARWSHLAAPRASQTRRRLPVA